MSAPSLHRESTDSLIKVYTCTTFFTLRLYISPKQTIVAKPAMKLAKAIIVRVVNASLKWCAAVFSC